MDFRPHWRGRERFVIFDSKCDGGAALFEAWRADPQRPKRLHVIALAAGELPGFQRVLQEDDAVTLDLLHAPMEAALAQLSARIDAVVLHGGEGEGFARPLSRLLARDAVLWSEGLSDDQIAELSSTGWKNGVRSAGPDPDVGDSGVRSGGPDPICWTAHFATRKPIPPAPPEPERRAIVIGAGLAGAAACERLCARGWQVTLVERHAEPAMEASGNLAGITMPLLSKDDNVASRLSRAAFLFARDYWSRLGGVGAAIDGATCGVLLAAKDAANAGLQRAIAAARQFPPGYAQWLEPGSRFGALAPHGAWLFPQGGWIRPASACRAMLGACGPRLKAHFGAGSVSLERDGDAWRVRGADGQEIARAPIVIVAAGAGQLAQTAALPLDRVRGQVTHLAPEALPDLGLVLCREAYVTPVSGGVKSAGASYDDDDDPALRASSQLENLDKVRSMLADPELAQDAPLAGRVGFRSVAPDRLPLVGALPEPDFALGAERLRELPRQPGLYGLLGYASRGLTWAPLAAELLAAALEHEPLPLEAKLAEALDPGRFLLRARRGGS
ncbi:FAD-dependent 5-carboxymethylaminomethyl-2-thiouridine(34) oxidoreductase MnmC [Massilia sp. R2A-15]|uniref:FAD-dependent 5-carboxymethylaminomethyl-2-thiouridine(34) oxidoreductase MnmC n=1 Tax=Massilia sp. R2A-15 TaxID=3064278 RepID=UPI0027352A75|nr:FAD-dependent 5-carboxymethylaminomethyl-2-thiouridine(34) oxidoreductase MnmC [Massilia sp. R2A-15]WLI89561.1 FAD-dependent 5-carboxymethylaminomethyl-2-thiouridine(34) oxidoreductase MnmC [Massilia sp. R2A-15]